MTPWQTQSAEDEELRSDQQKNTSLPGKPSPHPSDISFQASDYQTQVYN